MNPESLPEATLGSQCWVGSIPDVQVHRIGCVTLGTTWTHHLYDSSWRLYRMKGNGAGILYKDTHMPLPDGRPVLIPAWLELQCIPGAGLQQEFIQFSVANLPTALIKKWCTHPLLLENTPEVDVQMTTIGLLASQQGDQPTVSGIELLCASSAANMAFINYFHSLRKIAQSELEGALRAPHPVQRWAAEISRNPLEDWSVDFLASKLHCTREHLSRLFQRHLHQPPAQFIREQRLIHAARQLLKQEDSIDEIAASCRFADRYSFSKAFRKQFKASPAHFRAREWVQASP